MEQLASRYGKENVKINTAHHLQILDHGHKHDIWRGKEGLKWMLAGSRRVHLGSPDRLLQDFNNYNFVNTDMAQMAAAIELCRVIDTANRIFARKKITRAIFCDAGYKSPAARIGIILIDGSYVNAIRREVQGVADINEAECKAIDEAIVLSCQYSPDNLLDIYTDSQHAVNVFKSPRIKWIDRGNNKAADKLANLRDDNANNRR